LSAGATPLVVISSSPEAGDSWYGDVCDVITLVAWRKAHRGLSAYITLAEFYAALDIFFKTAHCIWRQRIISSFSADRNVRERYSPACRSVAQAYLPLLRYRIPRHHCGISLEAASFFDTFDLVYVLYWASITPKVSTFSITRARED
jgi:hypothetical protein